jgi:hypothetical protein
MFAGARGRERLDPPRWRLSVLRRAALLRSAAVAALLCLAAGVLLIDERPAPRAAAPAPLTATGRPGPALPAGTVGFPLRLPDAGVVAVVRPGQRVDVLASTGGAIAKVLAADVLVLRVGPSDPAADGALLYLAVTTGQAGRLASLEPDARISVTVRSP